MECEEFQMGKRAMISGVRDIRDAREWVDSFEKGGRMRRFSCCWGKRRNVMKIKLQQDPSTTMTHC